MPLFSRTKRLKLALFSLGTILIILVAWHLVTASGLVLPIFLPSPQQTFNAMVRLLTSGRFFIALAASLGRILVSTVLAIIIGTVIGFIMGLSEKIEYALAPITEPLHYLPLTALIPLLVLWFGIGESMKISLLFIATISYFIPLVRDAIRKVPQNYIDVARSFGADKQTIIKHIHWQQALPRIFEGLIVVNAIGWNYIILAEIINAKNGLGFLINIAGRLQRSDEVFAGLILIAFVAIVSDRILRIIRNRVFFW